MLSYKRPNVKLQCVTFGDEVRENTPGKSWIFFGTVVHGTRPMRIIKLIRWRADA